MEIKRKVDAIAQKSSRKDHASNMRQAHIKHASNARPARVKQTSSTRPTHVQQTSSTKVRTSSKNQAQRCARLTKIKHASNAHLAKPPAKTVSNPSFKAYNTHPPHAAKKAAMHTHRSLQKQPTKRRSISNNGSTPRSFPPRKPCTDPRDFRAYTPCGTTDIHSAA